MVGAGGSLRFSRVCFRVGWSGLDFVEGSFYIPPFTYMALTKVTGKTKAGLKELRREFEEKPRSKSTDFEDYYCLAKIPRQPDDYDGPKRFCVSYNLEYPIKRCKFHGGCHKTENLDPLANMKHGMRATRESILTDMESEGNEWQIDLYEWIVGEWPKAYDINVEDDPVAEYEFHALAVEVVRAERAEGYVLREGENGKKRVFSPTGEQYFDDIPHYLADMIQRQRKLIMKMEDNLGISRKKRLQNEQASDATDLMKSFAEVGASLITDSGTEYDPEQFEPESGS